MLDQISIFFYIIYCFFPTDKSPHPCWRPTISTPPARPCSANKGSIRCTSKPRSSRRNRGISWKTPSISPSKTGQTFFFGGKMMLKTSDRLKPLNPKVFETNKKYTQRMHQIWSSNLTVSFDNKSPHPPNWWSNNLLSMVPCVVLCHWWWLEPRSNVAVPPLRPRWHISDTAAIFMTFPDDSGWEQEVTNKIHRLVKISRDCFF